MGDDAAVPRLALVATSWRRNGHADAIGSKLVLGTSQHPPRSAVGAVHLLQAGADDVGIAFAAEQGIPVYHSVAAALCEGGDDLSVDGVVIIGEHGDYPRNAYGQKLYPRREIFDQVIGVFRQAGRSVPVFTDKHLSWNWSWARHMWAAGKELGVPLLAGSCVPFADFGATAEWPDCQVDEVVTFAHGPTEILEDYGYHAVELAQALAESGRGALPVVTAVRLLSGQPVLDRLQSDQPLIRAALGAIHHPRAPLASQVDDLHAFEISYRDGLLATCFMLGGYCEEFGFAYSRPGPHPVVAGSTGLDSSPELRHFEALTDHIETLMITGVPPVDAARTLVATAAVAAGMVSRARGGQPVPVAGLDWS